MANQLLTISWITNDALPVLANELVVADKVNRQYDKLFGVQGRKIGGTANVRLPPRYLGTFGPALNVEPSTETYVPVPILYQFHVDIQFSTINLALDVDEFRQRFIHPACVAVANRIDSDCAFFAFQNTANRVGVPGTPPVSYKYFSDARAILASEGMPKNMMPTAVMSPFAMSSMTDSLKGLFNPQAQLSENFETGLVMRKTAGADWFEDQNIASYTTGTLTGTPVLSGITAATGGSAILTSGWAQTGVATVQGLTNTAAQCYVGDTITIAGLFPVNPQSRNQYSNNLKTFVVLPPAGYAQMIGSAAPGGPQFATATLTNGTFNATTGLYTSSGGGKVDLTIGECIITGGQFQNVKTGSAWTGTPAVVLNGGAASGTVSTENLYFNRDFMAMATVDLPLPGGTAMAARAKDEDLGLSIRMVTQYTINNDAEPTRMDVAYGFGSLYRTMGVRVSG